MKKIFISVLILLVSVNVAFALSINIDPSNVKILLKTGDSKSGEIIVRNTSGSPVRLRAYVEDWIYAEDGSKTFMKPGSSVFSCSNWIKLDSDAFELSPKEERKVSYVISSPPTASGSHVSVIFFESLVEEQAGIAVSGRIGTIIYQDTEGTIKVDGELSRVSVSTSEEGKPVNAAFSFINKGNSMLLSKAKVTIVQNDKDVLETRALPVNTLPGESRTVNLSFSPLKEGKYKIKTELSYGDKTLNSQADFTIKKISPK